MNRFRGRNLPSDDCQPGWELHVYEVPRLQRRTVRVLLDSEGISRLQEWLNMTAPIEGQPGAAVFTAYFNETQKKLEYETTIRAEPRIFANLI